MSYFKSDGNFIYLAVPYAEFYIPKYYFDGANPFAEERGYLLNTFGIFNVGIFKNGNLTEMKTMNLPAKTDLFVYDTEERKVDLPGQPELVPCKVLKYTEGAKVLRSGIIENSDNVIMFLHLITGGKLPHTISYDQMLPMWLKNMALNNVNFGVPNNILELVLSASCRDKNDPTKKFSVVAGKDLSLSPYDYEMASIRQICQYTSTYTALTFEDFDTMVTSSLNRAREHREEVESPVEKVLKM